MALKGLSGFIKGMAIPIFIDRLGSLSSGPERGGGSWYLSTRARPHRGPGHDVCELALCLRVDI